MYKFEFSKKELEEISDKALLSDEEIDIIKYKIKGYSNIKIADIIGCGTATLSRKIIEIFKKITKVI